MKYSIHFKKIDNCFPQVDAILFELLLKEWKLVKILLKEGVLSTVPIFGDYWKWDGPYTLLLVLSGDEMSDTTDEGNYFVSSMNPVF